MKRDVNWNGQPRGSGKSARAFLVMALLMPALGLVGIAAPGHAQAHAHPLLVEKAVSEPNAKVSVIVQKTARGGSVEDAVRGMGGAVAKDLNIINAFAAEMTAESAIKLSKSAGVRWISPDAPVNKMSGPSTFTTWASEQGVAVTSRIASDFNSTPIAAGRRILFTSQIKVSGLDSSPATVSTLNGVVEFTSGGQTYKVQVPASSVTYTTTNILATTTYDPLAGAWMTNVPARLTDKVFLAGAVFTVPTNLPGGIRDVRWSTDFLSSKPGVSVEWKWAAATYSSLPADLNLLGIKPCEDSNASIYRNSDKAGTPELSKASLVAGARGTGGTNYTGSTTSHHSLDPANILENSDRAFDSQQGPNDTYASIGKAETVFGGFEAETTPGNAITRVEMIGRMYAANSLGHDMKIHVIVGDELSDDLTIDKELFDGLIGHDNATDVTLDLTALRSWQWGNFDNGVRLYLDSSGLDTDDRVYFDAVGLRVTSAPGNDTTGGRMPQVDQGKPANLTRLQNSYNRTVKATDVWNMTSNGAYVQGQGVSVAVIDSGVYKTDDIDKRVLARVNFNGNSHDSLDSLGHGTFVAGIIGGNGKKSGGERLGIAPRVNLINLRVADDNDTTTESTVVEALQWVMENKARYNIRVVNLSLTSTVAQSYLTSPLNAAVEILWFNQVVVVVSAGNNGSANLFPPANDPFVITVGATNDRGTSLTLDDIVAPYSAYGTDETGGVKPDLVAPGTNIIGPLPENDDLSMTRDHPSHQVDKDYFRMSGTSMAAPMVSGAVALLLQDEPNLTPDQVKYRLKATALSNPVLWPGYNSNRAGAGLLDVHAAVTGTTTANANVNLPVSQLLWTGPDPLQWQNVNWNNVNWNNVNWNNVNWNNVNWNNVNWNADHWDE